MGDYLYFAGFVAKYNFEEGLSFIKEEAEKVATYFLPPVSRVNAKYKLYAAAKKIATRK